MTADKIWDCDCGGEHHTAGLRSWCLGCSEWCSPDSICEVQALRIENAELRSGLAAPEKET